MPKLIILRLHPVKPIDGDAFTNYLNGLTITAYDLSLANNKEGNPVGQPTRYLSNSGDLTDNLIFQQLVPLNLLNTKRQKVAIAHTTDKCDRAEKQSADQTACLFFDQIF